MTQVQSIAFIVAYFGKWPIWFPAFLKSCESNPTTDWIFLTDCETPSKYPANLKFVDVSMEDMAVLFSNIIGTNVNIQHPIKFCDLKPTYGHVFEEYLKGYNFWGFCDIDIIWGDIRKFITEEMLEQYDLISARKNTISGHFTILRNNLYNRLLYKTDGIYKELFKESKYRWFDENAFAIIINEKKHKGELKVWWNEYLVNHERDTDSHQEYYLDRWVFDNGKLYNIGINGKQKVEHMYLHFINWKVTMNSCDIGYTSTDDKFYISYSGIHYNEHTEFQKRVNDFKNIFVGYWKKESRRKAKIKLVSIKKCIQERINKINSDS